MHIYIIGEKNDTEINNLIKKTLTNFIDKSHRNIENQQKIFIHENSSLDYPKIHRGIIIFKNSFNKNQLFEIPNDMLCILDPTNKSAVNLLSHTKLTAITCGTSIKDTLSIASLTPGRAVVSIQRNIVTLNNKTIEARDIVIDLSSKYATYSILSACALINLADCNSKYINRLTF